MDMELASALFYTINTSSAKVQCSLLRNDKIYNIVCEVGSWEHEDYSRFENIWHEIQR